MIKLMTATQLDYFSNIYIDSSKASVKRDDYIIAETKSGKELLRVVKSTYEIPKDNIVEPDGQFIKFADDSDLKKYHENEYKAADALQFCKKFVEDDRHDMKIVNET